MATDKQREAARRNGAKSTGPKTEAGKRKSARNSTKHGLTSHHPFLFTNESEEYYSKSSTDTKPNSNRPTRPKPTWSNHSPGTIPSRTLAGHRNCGHGRRNGPPARQNRQRIHLRRRSQAPSHGLYPTRRPQQRLTTHHPLPERLPPSLRGHASPPRTPGPPPQAAGGHNAGGNHRIRTKNKICKTNRPTNNPSRMKHLQARSESTSNAANS